ncbi:MAG: hypothetical protein RID93_36095 [Sandaracinaceae bacterium]
METLVAKLVARIRDAEAAGRTWELTDLAGRRALRVRRDEGVETTFLSDEQEAALREMLVEGPPTLDVEGLPRCTWDARRGAFLAAVDGVDLRVETSLEAKHRDAEGLARAARAFGRVRARLQSIRTETAEKLLPNAEAWGAPTDLAALTACLTIVSIAVNDDPRYADEAHVMMSDGDAFAGHWNEVFLDEDAVVMDASLAG